MIEEMDMVDLKNKVNLKKEIGSFFRFFVSFSPLLGFSKDKMCIKNYNKFIKT